MAVVDELVTLLSLQVDPKADSEASRFQEFLTASQSMITQFGSSLITVENTISTYIIDLANSAAELGTFSNSTGIAVEDVQNLRFAVQNFDEPAETLQSDLMNLTQSMDSPIPSEFNDTMLRMYTVSKTLADGIASNLIPAITSTKDIDKITSTFKAMSDPLIDLLPALSNFNDILELTNIITLATTGELELLTGEALVAAAPFIAIGAAIAGVLIILEDLYTYFKGGPSLIGDFVDAFTSKFPAISKVLKSFGHLIKEIIIGNLKMLWSIIKGIFGGVFKILSWIGKAIGKTIMGGMEGLESILEKDNRGDKIAKTLNKTADDVHNTAEYNAQFLAPAQTVNNATHNKNTNNPVQITVNGSGEPVAVAYYVKNLIDLNTGNPVAQ